MANKVEDDLEDTEVKMSEGTLEITWLARVPNTVLITRRFSRSLFQISLQPLKPLKMSWRSHATVTGTNDTPLANPRRFGPTTTQGAPASPHESDSPRGRSEEKSATPDPGKQAKSHMSM